MTCQEWTSVISDSLVALAAMTTVVVAFVGLSTWKKELSFKHRHDTAIRLLRAVYQIRDSFQSARSSISTPDEFPERSPRDSADREKNAGAYAKAFNERLLLISSALTEAYPAILEAEVLWGAPVKEHSQVFFGTNFRLRYSMQQMVNSIMGGSPIEPDLYTIIYNGHDHNNEWTKKIEDAVIEFEKITKPHLVR